MNNILILMKANITNSWGINKLLKSKSKGDKVKAVLLGIAIFYAFLAIVFSMFVLNMPFAQALEQLNALDVILASSVLSTTAIGLVLSTYKMPSYLFAFKDYDLLMSLPVKPSEVLTSKMVFIYLSNLLLSVVVSVPPLVIYGIKTSSGLFYYIFVVVITIFTPLIPISIAAILAYLLGRISSKIRSTNAFMIIGSMLLCAILIVGSPMIGQINSKQIQGALPAFDSISNILFWTKFYVGALKQTSIIYLAEFVGLSLLIFTVFIGVMSKGFKTINSRMTEKYRASNYKMTALKVSSPLKALYTKELRFYLASFIYVVNTAIGPLMMTVFSLALVIFGKEAVAKTLEIPMAEQFMPLVVTLVFAFCINMTFITASSISLEGKNLWIIKSLPVEVKSILWSKVLLNLTFTVPSLLINTLIVSMGFGMEPVTVCVSLLLLLIYCVFSAVTGLIINLYLPKLEWTTQVAVVKQGASVLVNMLAGFGSIIVSIVAFILIKPASMNIYLFLLFFLFSIITLILIRMLNTVGVRKFNQL